MKFAYRLKSTALLLMLLGFYFSATVTSCGNKKSESTEEAAEHPEGDAEHPAEGGEHPDGGSEHPQ
ncbi:hypothetical protein [Cyclobacterium xiamenense]|uniref:hypothetical protein n=1 Tax=Cyclobacterium xiamenense TaxID=1297121 RepID=UPI0035CEDC94